MATEEDNYSGRERRRFPRESIVVVEYVPQGREEAKKFCFPRNISLGGLSIIVNEDLPLNTVLLLTLYLPKTNTPIEVKGIIRWKKDILHTPHKKHWIFGLEFTEIPEELQKKLSEEIV